MTGSVPYYGGRMSPAQAYAASHPGQDVPFAVAAAPPRTASPPPDATASPPPQEREDPGEALDRLLESGVITDEEYARLRDRVTS
jgi:hypothetical protein